MGASFLSVREKPLLQYVPRFQIWREMEIRYKIVTTLQQFKDATNGWSGLIACDTETYGELRNPAKRHLLGISFAPESVGEGLDAVYIPLTHYENEKFQSKAESDLVAHLRGAFAHPGLSGVHFVGHNFTYDQGWLTEYGFHNTWKADTRLMWHMANAPKGHERYKLKDGQEEILSWDERGDRELDENVKSKGGSLKNGDHYMADLPILGKYAALDAYSTMQLYKAFSHFFNIHEYWPMLDTMMKYSELLAQNTREGILVDVPGLELADKKLSRQREIYLKKFFRSVKEPVASLEEDWKERRAAVYKREYNKVHFLATPEKWEKFNLNSDAHKRELFYGKLRFPVTELTEGGKPSCAAKAIQLVDHPAIAPYLRYEKATTLTSNFTRPYLGAVFNSRLNPGYNVCGTVTYRLSGFKPYLLNAPFDEKLIMQNLRCDEGYIGVHSDLAAIEPTITAHYSEDPYLLKVFRDGLGDIYLDLALDLLPNDKELHEGYNPRVPATKEVKERFARQRKVSKVVQLAVQYTGTGKTVAKNLTQAGIPTTVEEATSHVRTYWRKFAKIAQFEYRLRELNRREGHLRNVIGRIIRLPDPDYKDLLSRFIQSSGHDVLVLWVLKIYEHCRAAGIVIRPIILDCHDSTSNQVPKGQEHALKEIYEMALRDVAIELGLSVSLRCETKFFHTLAGLKGDE